MQVSKPVVGAVAAGFVVMIAVIAFLLGRESERHESERHESERHESERHGVRQVAQESSVPTRVDPLPPAPAAPSPAPTRAANATAIRDYFIRMESIQASGITGDSQEAAGSLLTSVMRGDSSGLDQIVKSVDDSVAKVRAITPPPECTTYHGKMLELLAQSQQLVRSLKSAVTSQDPNALVSLATTGDALKTKTEALEAEGKAIRTRAGL